MIRQCNSRPIKRETDAGDNIVLERRDLTALGRRHGHQKVHQTAMLVLVSLTVALATVAKGDITGENPSSGTCLCINGDGVNIRSAACGAVIGSAGSGQCFQYGGTKDRCSLGEEYEFFKIGFNGEDGWVAGAYLEVASDSRCGGVDAAGEYTCELKNAGKRIHEMMSHTQYDCVDKSCRNTCKGGQCVAYVTCNCKRNGKWAPNTSCWRPGQKVKTASGKCNRNIAPNTAIATFPSQGRYYGHAAVFIRCKDDYTVEVYDQGCCKAVSYSTYRSSHRFFGTFATILNPSCPDRASWPCRVENSGQTCCPISVPGCKNRNFFWEE